jgi:hypothetical protein
MTHDTLPDVVYADGSMEVRCTVTIEDQTHPMWLPVLDFKNKSIQNPSAFDINTARMRCLVKNFAVNFGLGHYIYAGESVPQAPPFTEDDKALYLSILALKDTKGKEYKANAWKMKKFISDMGEDKMTDIFNDAKYGEKVQQKADCRAMEQSANGELKAALEGIQQAIDERSSDSLAEIFAEMGDIERGFVNAGLSEVQIAQMRDIKRESEA